MTEMFHLGGRGEIRPIVRGFGSLASIARFDLDWAVADACDTAALTEAFAGCDVVVHCVMGDFKVIESSINPTYCAAEAAGVKRIVYLSTASVHGQAPSPGTDETTPITDKQPIAYNNHKVRAERRLLAARQRGGVEVVILRPAIVFGPRDRWVTGIARSLFEGHAFLVEGGTGICNTVYVDNLVHAIELASSADGVDGEAFLIGDAEHTTWAELTYQVADAFAIARSEVRHLPKVSMQRSLSDSLKALHGHPRVQSVLPFFSPKIKRMARAALEAWPAPPAGPDWRIPQASLPRGNFEISQLHCCRTKLPYEKARRMLGYEPIVSLDTGIRRAIDFVKWSGHPSFGVYGKHPFEACANH